MIEKVIVTRHAGQIEWLKSRGIDGPVLDRASADDVRGKHVIGTLPLELAAEAAQVSLVRFTNPAARVRLAETKGDIPYEEMNALGAELVTFRVKSGGCVRWILTSPDELGGADGLVAVGNAAESKTLTRGEIDVLAGLVVKGIVEMADLDKKLQVLVSRSLPHRYGDRELRWGSTIGWEDIPPTEVVFSW